MVFIEYPFGLIYKKNFKFLFHTVSEKNAMLTCKISKLFIRTIVQFKLFIRTIVQLKLGSQYDAGASVSMQRQERPRTKI